MKGSMNQGIAIEDNEHWFLHDFIITEDTTCFPSGLPEILHPPEAGFRMTTESFDYLSFKMVA